MLREIGLGTLILIILTVAVVLVALGQTADVGLLASGTIGVTDEVARSWGEDADLVVDEHEAAEATEEATAEAAAAD